MTSTKTNTSHSNISKSSNKRSLESDHDNDDEEEEGEWVGPMPDIAEKTSQDANVVQQQQKKQIISKKRRSKLSCFLFLFLFKKELKNVLKSRKPKNYRRFIWRICPRPKTSNASRHNNASNCVMVCIPKQIHPSKHLGNNSFQARTNVFFLKHGLCHNGKRRWSREIMEKRRRRIEFVKHFRTHLGKKRLFILLLWLLKNRKFLNLISSLVLISICIPR
jgi:hypothetical protein